MTRILNIEMPEPDDINAYLSGIDNVTDPSYRPFTLKFQTLSDDDIELFGVVGSYGKVPSDT
jgi:hypothetical protein